MKFGALILVATPAPVYSMEHKISRPQISLKMEKKYESVPQQEISEDNISCIATAFKKVHAAISKTSSQYIVNCMAPRKLKAE